MDPKNPKRGCATSLADLFAICSFPLLLNGFSYLQGKSELLNLSCIPGFCLSSPTRASNFAWARQSAPRSQDSSLMHFCITSTKEQVLAHSGESKCVWWTYWNLLSLGFYLKKKKTVPVGWVFIPWIINHLRGTTSFSASTNLSGHSQCFHLNFSFLVFVPGTSQCRTQSYSPNPNRATLDWSPLAAQGLLGGNK